MDTTPTPIQFIYLAQAEVDLAKSVFKDAFNTVQTGHANAMYVAQEAMYCRKIAKNLESKPDYREIVKARFEVHQWADRIEGLAR
jgi:thioredoxin-related protein